jgi:arabinofuranosyltransferase
VLVADERVEERFDLPGNDVGWMMYGWSILNCLAVGKAEKPSAETGRELRPGPCAGAPATRASATLPCFPSRTSSFASCRNAVAIRGTALPGFIAGCALAFAALAGSYAGWRAFWFLTDDAFIAFRYVANGVAGHGFVWNPPPFQPVEGYTSFLWVALLRLVWTLTGVEPPVAANWLSLGFGWAQLAVVAAMVRRMHLDARLAPYRLAFLALVLLGILANRTFLTWLSSGLETSLFNFLVLWWVYEGLCRPARLGTGWASRYAAAASLCALARPDGLLLWAATAGVLLFTSLRPAVRGAVRAGPAAAWLLVVPLHAVWRRAIYGFWLPNTYYAKHVRPWPEAGLAYLECFVLEYGVWVWLSLLVAAAVVAARRGASSSADLARELPTRLPALATLAVVVAHVGYYTLRVGGDHFEYRVYSQLVPLLFASALWLAARISTRPARVAGLLCLFIAASLPIPWVHWQATRHLVTRWETSYRSTPDHRLSDTGGRRYQERGLWWPIASLFPAPLRPAVERWDRRQERLLAHGICLRHQEHLVFLEYQRRRWPDRDEGARVAWEGRPVLVERSVGVPGWVLPGVAIIDLLGLNDAVVARTPVDRPNLARSMAHDRLPPPGYVECFRPNVRKEGGIGMHEPVDAPPRQPPRVVVEPRRLGDDEIRACESADWARGSAGR